MKDSSDHVSILQFRRWLGASMSGCRFAAALARDPSRIAFYVGVEEMRESELSRLSDFLDDTEKLKRVAILLFPRLRSPNDIIARLDTLTLEPRWSRASVSWREHPREDTELVGLTWTTTQNLRSDAMGFAPLGTMPVSRRAPYVAIALWAGGHDNPHFVKAGERVGFTDIANDFSADTHKKMWDATEERTRELLHDPPEDIVRLRRVAFCVPRSDIAPAA